MDKQFGKKIPTLVEAFAWILLNHRIQIANEPRIEPKKVREATEIYQRQNDIYRQFMEESIIEDKNKVMSLIELYNLFKDWYKESLPNHNVPVKNEVEEYFIKIWGIPEAGKKWKGYRQRTIQDEIDSGDAIVLTEDDLVDYNQS
jgi:phage/plasmid-associated DNA primase